MSTSYPPPRVTLREFREAFSRVSNWGRWGESDEKGTLNLLNKGVLSDLAGCDKSTIVVPLGRPLSTLSGPSNSHPLTHGIMPDADVELEDGSRFGHVLEYIGMKPHGVAITHVDALCHYTFDGRTYNNHPVSGIALPRLGTVATMQEGIVGRGVLLDAPRALGLDWIEPGHCVDAMLATRAVERQTLEIEPGDIVFVRTGRDLRERHVGPWPARDLLAGCDISFIEFLKDRDASMLGSDGVSDIHPSPVDGIRVPIHILALVAMGMPLIDNCALESLAEACQANKRWDFVFIMAPLVYEGGSSSPVNPLAILPDRTIDGQ